MKSDKSKSFSVTVLIDIWYVNEYNFLRVLKILTVYKQLINNKDHLLSKFLYQ